MTKEEYLRQLEKYLKPLPQEDRESAMQYFEEYFSDSGEANQQQFMEELGTPKEAAAELLKNLIEEPKASGGDAGYTKRKRRLLLLFSVIAAPVGMPLLLLILLVCFIGLILFGTVFFIITIAALASLLSGMRYLYLGICYAGSSLAAACTLFGAGLFESGLAIGIAWLEIMIGKGILKATDALMERRYRRYQSKITDKKGVGQNEME